MNPYLIAGLTGFCATFIYRQIYINSERDILRARENCYAFLINKLWGQHSTNRYIPLPDVDLTSEQMREFYRGKIENGEKALNYCLNLSKGRSADRVKCFSPMIVLTLISNLMKKKRILSFQSRPDLEASYIAHCNKPLPKKKIYRIESS